MYLVLRLKEKMSFFSADAIKIDLTNEDQGLIGMMPVFKTKEHAKALYPNHEIVELEIKKVG